MSKKSEVIQKEMENVAVWRIEYVDQDGDVIVIHYPKNSTRRHEVLSHLSRMEAKLGSRPIMTEATIQKEYPVDTNRSLLAVLLKNNNVVPTTSNINAIKGKSPFELRRLLPKLETKSPIDADVKTWMDEVYK